PQLPSAPTRRSSDLKRDINYSLRGRGLAIEPGERRRCDRSDGRSRQRTIDEFGGELAHVLGGDGVDAPQRLVEVGELAESELARSEEHTSELQSREN